MAKRKTGIFVLVALVIPSAVLVAIAANLVSVRRIALIA
tara:strand:+ start:327 stop:443 length:117 start_codon:yes stop_codon:yes gene_type:complete